MTVQQILKMIARKYPHALTNDDIIDELNTIQAELFRTIYKPTTTTAFDILAGNPFYPISFSPSKIIDVLVYGTEYSYQSIKKSAFCGGFYYITEDNCIGIYPTPKEDATGGLTVFRYKEPALLSSSNLGAYPDFDKDYHMLFVYSVCKQLAEDNREFDLVNGFVSQINGLMNDFDKAKEDPDYETIDNVYGGELF